MVWVPPILVTSIKAKAAAAANFNRNPGSEIAWT